MKRSYKFLKKHTNEFRETYKSLRGNQWSLNFPVYLFDRDWFKLKKVKLYDLKQHSETTSNLREKIIGKY